MFESMVVVKSRACLPLVDKLIARLSDLSANLNINLVYLMQYGSL